MTLFVELQLADVFFGNTRLLSFNELVGSFSHCFLFLFLSFRACESRD